MASDEELLLASASDERAFAELYGRYERPLAAFFLRAAGSGELAADLTAETFAQALASLGRYDPEIGAAGAWLYGIARHVLARSWEKGRVEDRARRALGIGVLALDDEMIERIEALAGDEQALRLLAGLPADQRVAVTARVIEERDYEEIAAALACSESVVRKRVSRGLQAMRRRWREER
jgi:RNA polymerase sigma-70 factor (ECF subfamily)